MILSPPQTIVIGDIGGHYIPFVNTLQNLGINLDNPTIPPHYRIIQIGDLIHKGPDTQRIVQLVSKIMSIPQNRNRWTQLSGNHEAQHLGGIKFWDCDCDHKTIQAINNWARNKKIKIATTHRDPATNQNYLITHAGVNLDWLKQFAENNNITLDHKDALQKTVQLMNETLPLTKPSTPNMKHIHQPGMILGIPNPTPGCIWALGYAEVWKSWNTPNPVPEWNQIIGHTTVFKWEDNQWWEHIDEKDKQLFTQDPHARTTTLQNVNPANTKIVMCDPAFGMRNPNIHHIPYLTL